ncbi:type II toxin-antitoxin system CcdA family antitoxin [Marinobacterium sp. LSUCC0821]|jgi:antitoxin CcdA|uniref:type II toxin-antitoxin system CcdA family antitoxin n=1 Tax=Marinobacterium sp. LSUCC0821 TaxID=2668067 RepID=UPI0014513827|nr:type II toxin-antitoxin system CcdA family antitoxin [Marinobacterium sp. LSUCC0821]QJD72197.1 type II toxin-antitoxin system CcdA family antitoxin [Marinobacterium sp. LSUCC0821]
MHSANPRSTTRRPTNLSIDAELLTIAKEVGVNISRSAEVGIQEAVKNKLRERWLQENKEALLSSNAFVEENGLPLEKFRSF